MLDNKKKIIHGGSHGQVEVSDLLLAERELIRVKRYSIERLEPPVAQGFVSGQLIQVDAELRKKIGEAANKIRQLIDVTAKPEDKSFTIVYGIISDEPGAGCRLHLRFFRE